MDGVKVGFLGRGLGDGQVHVHGDVLLPLAELLGKALVQGLVQQLDGLVLVRRQTGDALGQLQSLAADLPVGHGHVAHLALHILQQGGQGGLLVLKGQLHLAARPQ